MLGIHIARRAAYSVYRRLSWKLSNGSFVTPQATAIVIAPDEVVGFGDSLFPWRSRPTWRYAQ
jgi:hypothetical protein